MLARLALRVARHGRDSSGASLLELGVALLLLSLVGVGSVGSVAVGTKANSALEDQDIALIVARSQAEFIASKPTAPTYSTFPSIPEELTLTVSTGDAPCTGQTYLQCVRIDVFRDGERKASLEAAKAERFLDQKVGQAVVPKSGGLERVTRVAVPDISPLEGVAIKVSQVFGSFSFGDRELQVRWELTDAAKEELRTIAIYEGQPFGSQTGDLTTLPDDVAAPLASRGQLRKNPRLGVTARAVDVSQSYTIYLFNESEDGVISTNFLEVICVCAISP